MTRKARANPPQFSGAGARKRSGAVALMTAVTTTKWTVMVRAGIDRIAGLATPLILKLRKIPASRALTRGSGRPSRVAARMANTTMAGTIVGRKKGLKPGINTPIIR